MMNLIVFFLSSVIISLLAVISSSFSDINKEKVIRSGALSFLLLIYQLFFGTLGLINIYIYLFISILIGGLKGGIIAISFSSFLLYIYGWNLYNLFYFLIIVLIGVKVHSDIEASLKDNIGLNLNLSGQIKELRVLREISAILQGTLKLNKVLHIILSSVTSGHGLGFNRAILFLVKDNKLKGEMGIGPLSKQEGLQTWQNIVLDKIDLEEMILAQEELDFIDKKLNDIVKEISVPLRDDSIVDRVIEGMVPSNVSKPNLEDDFQLQLVDKLDMGSFVLIPLIVKGKAIGMISVDNIANGSQINYKEVDSLMPFANQAALAIENARLHKLKEDMAIKDNLTGLYNQRYFQVSLEKKIKRSKGSNSSMALLMIDIDYFKAYNDNNGHLAGNEALIKLAKILENSVREGDIVCRFGGEEFSIILPDVSQDLALSIAQRIRKKVFEASFKNEDTQPNGSVSISTGIGIFAEDASSDRELLNAADEALYYAKNTGRNNVKTYKEYISNREDD